MAIASDIRPGDDPVEVSEKLVGRTRTKLLNELFGYFDIPVCIEGLAIAKEVFEKTPTSSKNN